MNNIEIHVSHACNYKGWMRVYKRFGDNMMPFEDDDPQESWRRCGVKWCKQIYLGKLWKCPNLAYLQMQDKKFNLHPKWNRYLTYRENNLQGQAIEPTATYEEIKTFYEEEHIPHCAMCPAKVVKNLFKLPPPFINKSDENSDS